MDSVSTAWHVIDIPQDRLDEATDVLTRAFVDYPLMRYFFSEDGTIDLGDVREAFRLTCALRMANNVPVKGIILNNRLIAVACLDLPEPMSMPESMEQVFTAFIGQIGAGAVERLERYRDLTASTRPAEPHCYLVAIGVLPDLQGKGYGRVLLNTVHTLSMSHPSSTGVGLDTETAGNVPLYEHVGYRVEAKTALGEVPVWCMFQPNDVIS